jgi:hypothetical protein
VLEVIHVDIAGSEADVGGDPVGEFDQFDFQTLFVGFGSTAASSGMAKAAVVPTFSGCVGLAKTAELKRPRRGPGL